MGSKQESPPPAPSPAETTREAIKAQIESLPDILKAQKEYAPQFTEEQIKLLSQYGPQLIEQQVALERTYGPEYAELMREQQAILAPERIQAQSVLKDYLSQEQLLTPGEERQFKTDIRGAQSVRGLAESGEAAIDELRQLTELRNQLKMQRINVALSSAGLVPTGVNQTVGSPQLGGQLVQNATPSEMFGLASNNYNQQMALYKTGNSGSLSGATSGAIGGGVTGAATGAVVGSVVPVIGTTIGAIGGGLVGALGGGIGGYYG